MAEEQGTARQGPGPGSCDAGPGKIGRQPVITAVAVVFAGLVALAFWKWGEPKRGSFIALARLERCLVSPGAAGALDKAVLVPLGRAEQTVWEREDFLRKALRDEISPAGIAAIKREGTFGPLKEVFPAEAEKWGALFGVDPGACFALKMERNGLRAEVVVHRKAGKYRVLRCNNVKQMAREGT